MTRTTARYLCEATAGDGSLTRRPDGADPLTTATHHPPHRRTAATLIAAALLLAACSADPDEPPPTRQQPPPALIEPAQTITADEPEHVAPPAPAAAAAQPPPPPADTTTDEPGPVYEERALPEAALPDGGLPEGVSVYLDPEPGPDTASAREVPPLHPDTAAPSWTAGTAETPPGLPALLLPQPQDPLYPGGEMPRPTEEIKAFASWCVQTAESSAAFTDQDCAAALHEMVWPIDYMGAAPQCVIAQYRQRFDDYTAAGAVGIAPAENGWHNCASVINPDPSDESTTLAERCAQVLPEGVELEAPAGSATSDQRTPDGCAAWAQSLATSGVAGSRCSLLAALATQWMQYHYLAPDDGSFVILC